MSRSRETILIENIMRVYKRGPGARKLMMGKQEVDGVDKLKLRPKLFENEAIIGTGGS